MCLRKQHAELPTVRIWMLAHAHTIIFFLFSSCFFYSFSSFCHSVFLYLPFLTSSSASLLLSHLHVLPLFILILPLSISPYHLLSILFRSASSSLTSQLVHEPYLWLCSLRAAVSFSWKGRSHYQESFFLLAVPEWQDGLFLFHMYYNDIPNSSVYHYHNTFNCKQMSWFLSTNRQSTSEHRHISY